MNTQIIPSENNPRELPDIIKIIPNEPNGIEKYLDQCDLVHNETAIIRERMISQLGAAVSEIQFDFNGNSLDDVEKKIMAVETLNKLIDSREKSMNSRVNNRLKNKELKGNEALGKIAADLLMKIDLSAGHCIKNQPLDPSNLAELESVTCGMEDEIREDELRDDPYNLE